MAKIALLISLASVLMIQQSPAAPPWMQLTIVHVAPAMVDEYVAVQREVSARIRKIATTLPPSDAGGGGRGGFGFGPPTPPGPAWRIVSRSEFGDSYRFLISIPVQNLASLDTAGRPPDPELTVLNTKAQKYVTAQQTYAVRNLPEIDNPLPQNQQPALMVVSVVRVVPGREQDYYNLMKTDFFPHFDKANVFHTTGSVVFGGEGGFIHQYFYNNFAALDAGSPVVKALGPAGAQAVTAKLSGIVGGSEQWITRVVPELSYGPWSPPPKQ